MEYKLLNEQQHKRMDPINRMIARGIMPSADDLSAFPGRHAVACGCPEQLLRSVVAKNAAITRSRAKTGLKVPARVAAKVRSRIAQRAVAKPALTQEQINHLVDTRDQQKYPLSGYEERVLAERERQRRIVLDF